MKSICRKQDDWYKNRKKIDRAVVCDRISIYEGMKKNEEDRYMPLFEELREIVHRPEPHACYTTPELWNDPHISKQMLTLHLDPDQGLASRTGAQVDASARWIAEHFRLGPESRVCDFGCGPGLFTERFAQQGAHVTGIDLSERSIAYARKVNEEKKLGIDYVLQNYLETDLQGPFDLITLIFCDFCVLSPGQRQTLLRTFKKLLAPQGHLLLDVITGNFYEDFPEQQSWEWYEQGGFWAQGPHHVLKKSFRYEDQRLLLDKYVVLESGRRRESYNWLQCFELEDLRREFAEAGLRIVAHYADVAGNPAEPGAKELAVVAAH